MAFHTHKHHAGCGNPTAGADKQAFHRLFGTPAAQAVVLHSFATYYGHFQRRRH